MRGRSTRLPFTSILAYHARWSETHASVRRHARGRGLREQRGRRCDQSAYVREIMLGEEDEE